MAWILLLAGAGLVGYGFYLSQKDQKKETGLKAMHTRYEQLRKKGFTREQALDIIEGKPGQA